MTSLPLEPEAPPLRVDAGGAVRVGQTRVTLDIVVHAYRDGRAPEDVVRRYPTLTPADVYGAIAYYLRHREVVDAYLDHEQARAAEMRGKLEALPENAALRARAQARAAARQRA